MFNPNVTATLSTAAVLFIDEWQEAADNGYGLGQWWGDATDITLIGFDCLGDVLRNLVALSWFVTLLGCNVIDAIWNAYLGYRAVRQMQLRLALLPTPRMLPAAVDLGPELSDEALVSSIAAAIAPTPTLTIIEPVDSGLSQLTVKALKEIAKGQGVKGCSSMKKAQLLEVVAV